ncbi:tail fiber assembly protein [Gilliamella sp. CG13]|uniref:tail fiber assembly protein n=1 Tax=unclassified Gilliamella TaxID=2685620 RepID=UPI003987D891
MIYYNATNNGFYVNEINEIPSESVEITAELHAELMQKQSEGFTIKPDENGAPVAVKPTLNTDEIRAVNKARKSQLISYASQQLSILQDVVEFSEATDNDIAQLIEWRRYRVALSKIDADVGHEIEWPEQPV